MAVEAVVGFLLTKLDSFIRKNVSLLTGLETEVGEMQFELLSIKTFLASAPDSSIEEVVVDDQLQLWIKNVREVAYDIEDVLDEFTLKLKIDSRKAPKIAKRLEVGKKLKEIKRRLHNINELKDSYFNNQWSIPGNDGWQDPRDDFHPESADDIVGIEDHVKELKEWLMNDSGPAMISVVGMPGLGKTALVKRVYNDEDVKGWFECRAWVRVSSSRTIKDKHLRCMMEYFSPMEGVSVLEGMGYVTGDQLWVRLQKFLTRKRYVLVLDDIWYTNALVDVRNKLLCVGAVGSKIMVTTRILNVENYSEVCHVNPLQLQDAWNLFCKKALPPNGRTEHFTDQLDDLSLKIVERWEGLPLAIVLVCRLLKTKSLNLIEWKKVHSNLASESASDSYKNAMKILSFSYSCLPYNLKSCFLHLGIFPEGQFIKRMRLIRLWMAEGFIEGNVYKTMEEVADDYLNELTNHSVLQVAERSDYGRVISYKVHPLMREFILLKSKEVNFCNKIVSNTQKLRRLSIDEGMIKDDLHASTLSHVRSFFAFGDAKSSISGILLNFKFLKVLDLESAPLQSFPESLTELFFLRYLSLENTKMKKLPKSLGKLVNLETLNLKGTFVRDLPPTIVKLQNMRHLLVYHYDMKAPPFFYVKAVKLPAGIDCLKSLQKLSYIKADSKRGTISELGKLTQLRRLGVVGVRKKDCRNLCASVANMKNLLSFSVRSAVADELVDLTHLETPPPGLQGLYLGGRLKKLPKWILSLQILARLTLGWSKFEEDPFPLLSSLPALAELKIIEAYSGEVLSCGEYSKGRGFPKLKSLCLHGLPKLESIDVTEGALASLVKLEIGCCGALKMLPPAIEHLTRLEELHLYCMPPRFVDDIRRQKTEGQIMSIKSILVRNSSSDKGRYL
ncbi:hypothetical protein AAC387_Pa09g1054 [Persea americana]